MLSLLHIENIAVIQSADIEFDRGFNVLTGETGAGKSIVIDSLSAVIGERTSRELIRTESPSALVSAVFTDLPPLAWFSENGIGPDENGQLILQREIYPDGKNICRAGGRPMTGSLLRALGSQLVNIHGQHDGQQLLDERYHLNYLDRFGQTGELLADFRQSFEAMSALKREIASLEMDEAEKSRRMDTLTYQIRELERAKLKPGEDEALAARRPSCATREN
jgi:DNA repair protein RecN (Recombination protein N)